MRYSLDQALAVYVLIVFGLEWLSALAFQFVTTPMMALFIGAWLPDIAGVLITNVADGYDGLRHLFSRVVRWEVGFKWYVIAWWVPVIAVMLALRIYALSGHTFRKHLDPDEGNSASIIRRGSARLCHSSIGALAGS